MARRHTYTRIEDGKKLVYFVESLWEHAAALPVRRILLSEIDIDGAVWKQQPTIDLASLIKRIRRVNTARLSYPIILSANGSVMDGYHRIIKAHVLGRKRIRAVQFAQDPPPDEVRSSSSRDVEES